MSAAPTQMEEGQALVAASASWKALWLAELKALGALALPVVLQTSAQQGLVVTDQIFLGHLGTAELGAAAIANSYTNLMWFFLLGFATALDTLGSNAFGAGDRRALVTWCVTAALLVTVLVGPVAVGMSLGGLAASSLFGQDAHTSALMGRFCVGLIPGMWPLMWGIVLTKYLQVQNVMAAPSVIAVGTFLLNIAFNAILVSTLGFRGAPLATTLSRWAQFVMLVAVVAHHEWRRTRQPPEDQQQQEQQEQQRPAGEQQQQQQVQVQEQTQERQALIAAAVEAADANGQSLEAVALLTPNGETEDRAGAGAGAGAPGEASNSVANGGASHGSSGLGASGARVTVLVVEDAEAGRGAGDGDGAAVAAGWGSASLRTEDEEQAEAVAAAAPKAYVHALQCGGRGGDLPGTGPTSTAAATQLGALGLSEKSCRPAATTETSALLAGMAGSSSAPVGVGVSGVNGVNGAGAGGSGKATAAEAASAWASDALAECRAAVAPGVILKFCKLGVPGGLSMAFEVGCFEFSTILAAALGPAVTAAHAAMLSLVALTYLACPFALATAGAIRVGNLLGAGQPEPARRSGLLAIGLSGGFMFLMALGLLASRGVLGRAFSEDPEVVGVIKNLTLFAALFQVSDGLMGSSQGVLRGCGHQHLTAVFNFIGFWVCGVLLGYLLCFKAHLGIYGLWTGIASGDSATALLNLVAIGRIKWKKEADQAVTRLQALAKQAEELQALVQEASVRGGRAFASGDTAAAAAATAAAALAAAEGDGLAANPAPVGGGGRSYAGGLKRVWSERRVRQTVEEERERRLREEREEAAAGEAKGFMAKMVRSLSSSFRNASLSLFRRTDSRQQQQQQQELPLGELDELMEFREQEQEQEERRGFGGR